MRAVEVVSHPMLMLLLGGLVLVSSLGVFMSDASAILGLLPANTLVANKYIWNLVTSAFYEESVLKLSLDVVLVVFVVVRHGLIVESYDQFGLYIIFNILASTVGTSAYCFVRFFTTGLEEMLLEPVFGFSAVLIPLAMYVRAYKRDTPIISGGAIDSPTSPHAAFLSKVTYNNLPVVLTLAQFLCYCIGPLKVFSKDMSFTFVSLLFSWSYCRFYYNFQDDGGNGSGTGTDAGSIAANANTAQTVSAGAGGDSYAFVAMFPQALQVIMVPLTTAFYNLVALTGLFPTLVVEEKKGPRHHLDRDRDASSSLNAASPLFKDSKPDVVQERRRARALKLLDAKMAELNAASKDDDHGWGDDGDDNEGGSAA